MYVAYIPLLKVGVGVADTILTMVVNVLYTIIYIYIIICIN